MCVARAEGRRSCLEIRPRWSRIPARQLSGTEAGFGFRRKGPKSEATDLPSRRGQKHRVVGIARPNANMRRGPVEATLEGRLASQSCDCLPDAIVKGLS